MKKIELVKIWAFLSVIVLILTMGVIIFSDEVVASGGMGSWTTKLSMPTARGGAAAAVVDGKIYVIGGYKSWRALSSNEMYDPTTNTWELKASMPTARAGFGVAVIDGKIYAIGGNIGSEHQYLYYYTTCNPIGVVEVYDPDTDSWINSNTPMPTPRYDFSIGVVDNKIYVIGGIGGLVEPCEYSDKCEVYDPLTDSWSEHPPLPNPRPTPGCAVVNNKIYIFGGGRGYTIKKICECYNPSTYTWDRLNDMPMEITSFASAVAYEKIYAIGGDNTGLCEQYDPSSDNWSSMTNMPTSRSQCVAASVNNKIYVIGGISNDDVYLTKNEEFTPSSTYTNEEPMISIVYPSNTTDFSGTLTISGTTSDNDDSVQKVQIKIDSGSWNTASGTTSWSYSWNTIAVNNGYHTISARSYDGEDYSEIASVTVSVYNPISGNQKPTVTITSPQNGDVISSKITINGIASDTDGTIQSVRIKIDSGSWNTASGTTSWSYSWNTTSLEDGSHVISARSYDGEDYSETVTTIVTVQNGNGGDNVTPGFEFVFLIVFLVSVV